MNISLHQSGCVHRAHEQRQENHPVVERRAVQERRGKEHRGTSDRELKGLLHGRSIA